MIRARRFAIGAAIGTTMSVGVPHTQIKNLVGELPVSTEHPYGLRPAEWVEGVVWHHSATKATTIRSIAEMHIAQRGWGGIAYHFAIGWDGQVYQLNDITTLSYHSQGHNSHTIGVVLIGNYQEREMTDAMKESIVNLQYFLKERYNLKYSTMHRRLKATLCPGDHATEFLENLMYDDR